MTVTLLLLFSAALLEALQRALAVFGDQARWEALQMAGMAQDYSWDRSAREYVKIYKRAMGEPEVTARQRADRTKKRDGQ